jgi:hypothetical protein
MKATYLPSGEIEKHSTPLVLETDVIGLGLHSGTHGADIFVQALQPCADLRGSRYSIH